MNIVNSQKALAAPQGTFNRFPRTSPAYVAALGDVPAPTFDECKPLRDLLEGRELPPMNEESAGQIATWCLKNKVPQLMRAIQRDYPDLVPRIKSWAEEADVTIEAIDAHVDAGIVFDCTLHIFDRRDADLVNSVGFRLAGANVPMRDLRIEFGGQPVEEMGENCTLQGLLACIESNPTLRSVTQCDGTWQMNSAFEVIGPAARNPSVKSLRLLGGFALPKAEELAAALNCGHIDHLLVESNEPWHHKIVCAVVTNMTLHGSQPIRSLDLIWQEVDEDEEIEARDKLIPQLAIILKDGGGVAHLRLPDVYAAKLSMLSEERMKGNKDLTSLQIGIDYGTPSDESENNADHSTSDEGFGAAVPQPVRADFASSVIGRNKQRQLDEAAGNIRWGGHPLPREVANIIIEFAAPEPGGASTLWSLANVNERQQAKTQASHANFVVTRATVALRAGGDAMISHIGRYIEKKIDALMPAAKCLSPDERLSFADVLRRQLHASIENGLAVLAPPGEVADMDDAGAKRALAQIGADEDTDTAEPDAKRPKN